MPLALRPICLMLIAVILASCATEAPPSQHVTAPIERWRTNYGEMSLFADSARPVTDAKVEDFTVLTGKAPVYWGRYICNNTPAYDLTADELSVFARASLKPILILQPGQSTLSGGSSDAQTAVQCFEQQLALLKDAGTYVFPSDLMIMLDVEHGTQLSADYLSALVRQFQSDGLLAGGARFGIYLSGAYSQETRAVIEDAVRDGLPISVLWFARYIDSADCGPLPYWVESNTDALGNVSVPNEMWQYAKNCHRFGGASDAAEFDLDVAKPPVYPWNGVADRISAVEPSGAFAR
jgi:hypothetical protein